MPARAVADAGRCQTLALAATLLTPPSPQATYLLFEAASGYAVFEALDTDLIASAEPRVQESIKCALCSAAAVAHAQPF